MQCHEMKYLKRLRKRQLGFNALKGNTLHIHMEYIENCAMDIYLSNNICMSNLNPLVLNYL